MRRQNGFSLVEIIVAMAISMVSLLAVAAIFRYGTESYKQTAKRAETKEYLSIAAHNFNNTFTYAQSIKGVTVPPISTSIAVGNPGELLIGNWDTLTTTAPGTWIPIANFRRESSFSANTAGDRKSAFRQTGIFYRTPTPTTAGVLFFTFGDAVPATLMTPSYSGVYIPNVVELTIDDPQYTFAINGITYLKSFHVKMSLRDYTTGNPVIWRWCPRKDIDNGMANCATTSQYKDLKQDFYINMLNTVLGAPDAAVNNLKTAERILGPIYVFPVKE
jgi:prepilin-type N-terminal cleavage/methylation domain-containing protein